MSALPSPADHEPGAGSLVEIEHELTRLLIEYDELETAWPKCRHVLIRAKAGRLAADALARIGDLQHDIATTPARTLGPPRMRYRAGSASTKLAPLRRGIRLVPLTI